MMKKKNDKILSKNEGVKEIRKESTQNASTTKDAGTTSQILFNHLFECCNILRGPINQDEYKSYIIPILFLKRISDVYDEETNRALKESGGDEAYASFPENHSFIIPDKCHWSDIRNKSQDVGKAIIDAMMGIEKANPDTLNGVFTSFDDASWTDKNKLSDSRLKNLIEHLSSIKIGNESYNADVMGDAYEYLIKKFADLSKKNAGEFYTPRSIVKLLVMLMDPKAGDDVYDPGCGTGGMLIEAIHHINDAKKTYGHIYGQEKNLATSAIARMNLFLHGAKDFKIYQGDTLRDPKFLKAGKVKRFDCVIANPPFGLEKWGADVFANDPYGRNIWGVPSDSNADYAWLQHMVCSMEDKKGRLAIILPQGALFHSGKEAQMRQKLIDSDKIECIITLVQGVFFSTGVSACIILLNNNKKPSHKNKICMIDASNIYTPLRAQNIMTEENVNEVYSIYKNYEDVIEKCKIVDKKDIKDTLIPKNYIDKKEAEKINPKEVKKRFIETYKKMIENEEKMKKLLLKGGYVSE